MIGLLKVFSGWWQKEKSEGVRTMERIRYHCWLRYRRGTCDKEFECPLEVESGPWMTATQEMGTSVVQL